MNLHLSQLLTVLGQGAQLGFDDFLNDLSHLSLSGLSTAASTGGSAALDISLPSFTEVVNALSGAASSAYSMLLPTADIVTAMLTTLPAYDVSLFLGAFQGGDLPTDLVNAIGMPIAADFGLGTMAVGFELATLAFGVESIIGDITGLF